jgi:hypothetical protein
MTKRRKEAAANLLSTLEAVSPAREKLMAERLALRQQVRAAQTALAEKEAQIAALQKVRDVRIPHYIAIAKSITIFATIAALIAFSMSLFTSLIEIKIIAPLFASLLVPLWVVDCAERHFGRWRLHVGARPSFVRIEA